MTFSDYLRILRQRGWLIVLLALLTAAAAYGFSRMQPTEYTSNIKLLITSRPDLGQTEAVKNEIRNYAEYLYSSKRAEAVIDRLQLDMNPMALLGQVRIEPQTDRAVIQIQVENSNQSVANDIAQAWAEELIFWRNELNASLRAEDRINAQLQDVPLPGARSPNVRINTAAGAVFGALMGILAIFLIEWLESGVVRRPDDVTRYLDIPVIGSIPK